MSFRHPRAPVQWWACARHRRKSHERIAIMDSRGAAPTFERGRGGDCVSTQQQNQGGHGCEHRLLASCREGRTSFRPPLNGGAGVIAFQHSSKTKEGADANIDSWRVVVKDALHFGVFDNRRQTRGDWRGCVWRTSVAAKKKLLPSATQDSSAISSYSRIGPTQN